MMELMEQAVYLLAAVALVAALVIAGNMIGDTITDVYERWIK